MIIDFNLIVTYLPVLAKGLVVTVKIAIFSCVIGFILGTILAFLQKSSLKLVRFLIMSYIFIIRGTPMLIQIILANSFLPYFGVSISPLWIAIIAIGLNSAAYISQIIKAGISSIGKGQIEAAKVLGFSPLTTIRYIILPQAIRVTLPALGSEFVTLIKDSALASLIGVAELTKQANFIKSRTHDALTIYFIVAVIYLILTSLVSLLVAYYEKRTTRHA